MAWMKDNKTGHVFETENPGGWENTCERMTAKAGKAAHIEQCRETLRGMIKPGDTVYTVLRHVNSSGMSRNIDLYIIRDGEPACISGYAAGAMDERRAKDGSIRVGGCGMDMGFHLVYNLGSVLYGEFYTGKPWQCIGQGCPSSDHQGARYEPHTPERMHKDGGYSLHHRWM
jgi:hypothetical protein